MDKSECTTAERETWHSWRFYHPHPRGPLKMEARYLTSQGLSPEDISRLCALSPSTFYRDLHEYRTGGIAQLTEGPFHQRQSQWADSRASLEAAFRQCPPATVAAAGAYAGAPGPPVLRHETAHRGPHPCQSRCHRPRSRQNRATRTALGRSQSGATGRLLSGGSPLCLCPVCGTGGVF